VVSLPTRAPELLGVVAIRAAIVPIYDLAAALGRSGAAATRWMVVHRAGQAGFAFERFDGHLRIAEGSIAAPSPRGHIVGQLVVDGQPRLVVDLGSMLTAIEHRWNQSSTAKEQ
jgi:purine-binding chemotaxis protein CheW